MKLFLTTFFLAISLFTIHTNAFTQCETCPTEPDLIPNGDFETVFEPICSDGSTMGNLFVDGSPVADCLGITFSDNLIGDVITGTEATRSNTPDFLSDDCIETDNSSRSCGDGTKSVGLWTAFDSRFAGEFIQIPLTEPLVEGEEYCVEFNAFSYTQSSVIAIVPGFEPSDGFGFYLSEERIEIENDNSASIVSVNIENSWTEDMIDSNMEFAASDVQNTNEMLDLEPYWEQPDGVFIPTECTPFNATFTAKGGEAWLIFGNFKHYSELTFDTTVVVSETENPYAYVILDDVCLKAVECPPTVSDIIIPNVITPNNDGFNDNFNYYFVDEVGEVIEDATFPVEVRLFQVYNRWGQLIYDNETPATGWDGRFNEEYATQDVYVYMIEMEIGEGTDMRTEVFKGDVTLIR